MQMTLIIKIMIASLTLIMLVIVERQTTESEKIMTLLKFPRQSKEELHSYKNFGQAKPPKQHRIKF